LGPQVPLQGLEFLAVLETDDEIGHHRFLRGDSGPEFDLGLHLGCSAQGGKRPVNISKQLWQISGADGVLANISADDLCA
jgi:hypothetical protein